MKNYRLLFIFNLKLMSQFFCSNLWISMLIMDLKKLISLWLIENIVKLFIRLVIIYKIMIIDNLLICQNHSVNKASRRVVFILAILKINNHSECNLKYYMSNVFVEIKVIFGSGRSWSKTLLNAGFTSPQVNLNLILPRRKLVLRD